MPENVRHNQRNRQMDLLACRRSALQGTTREQGRLLAEHLEAVACTLHHKNPVLIINVYRDGVPGVKEQKTSILCKQLYLLASK